MARWKGMILAGGKGTRLYPLTYAVSKHLLPVYDKPMIYYPLSTLMLCGVRDFIVIANPDSVDSIERLLGDGKRWGISIVYRSQERPGGIAECFRIAEKDLEGCNVALILGDNIFYGSGLPLKLREAMDREHGATIFGYEVSNPNSFGVVILGSDGRPIDLEEKPKNPRSHLAVPGLYFYDTRAASFASRLTPSSRGELEITDINRAYLQAGDLSVSVLGRGVAWLDGGTHRDLYEASQFIKVVEDRTGLKIACPEEVAWRMNFIDIDGFKALIDPKQATEYQRYLRGLIESR
jgi:glucose-1-phosphate thymidylyltransferase